MRPALAIFAVTAVAQWLLPLAGVWRHEQVIARGTTVRIECAAPDPYDPLRGRYLAVRPVQDQLPKPEGLAERETAPVWATLVAGADGLSRVESLSLVPVSGPTVIRLVATRSRWGQPSAETVFVEWPFDRFYLEERLASGADELVAARFREGAKPVAEVRLLGGRAVLTDVLIDGASIRDVVRNHAR